MHTMLALILFLICTVSQQLSCQIEIKAGECDRNQYIPQHCEINYLEIK